MNKISASIFSIFIAVAGTSAFAQEPTTTIVSPGQWATAPSASVGMTRPGQQPRPLFTIGGVEMHIWTPVAPPYNAEAYTNLSGRSIGEPG